MKRLSSLTRPIAPLLVFVFWFTAHASASTFIKNPLPDIGVPGNLVSSVAVSGNLVVVGIEDLDSAYLVETPCGGGNSTALLNGSGPGESFGAAVAISGGVAVGAPAADNEKGAVYVIEKEADWNNASKTRLTASGVTGYSQLGSTLAMSGNMIVTGAKYDDGSKGAAFVFEKSVAGWFQRAILTGFEPAAGDQFGNSLGIAGNVIIVTAYRRDADKGAAYLYDKTSPAGLANPIAILGLPDGAAGDQLGSSCAISDDGALIVLGTPGRNIGGNANRGAVFVFEKSGVSGFPIARLSASDGLANDRFGATVALSGNMIIVGAAGSKSTYIFEKPGDRWADMEEPRVKLNGEDFFGSYAFDGDNVVVGSFEGVFYGPFQSVQVLNPMGGNSYSLSISLVGNGRIASSPPNIDCGDCCEKGFGRNGTVTLRAMADAESAFDGWSDPRCPGNGDCTVTMDQDRSITATFNKDSDGDGISDIIEDAGPFGGDADGDGFQDRTQKNVVTFKNIHGQWCTLISEKGTLLEQVKALQDPSSGGCPRDKSFSEGFFGFRITGLTPQEKTVVKMILHTKKPALSEYFKYGPTKENPVPHWYAFPFNGNTGANITQEEDRTVINLHLQDGGLGDDDLAQDGVILDAGGPASAAASEPSSGSSESGGGGGGGGCFMSKIE